MIGFIAVATLALLFMNGRNALSLSEMSDSEKLMESLANVNLEMQALIT